MTRADNARGDESNGVVAMTATETLRRNKAFLVFGLLAIVVSGLVIHPAPVPIKVHARVLSVRNRTASSLLMRVLVQ
jgi:hypothetical protein